MRYWIFLSCSLLMICFWFIIVERLIAFCLKWLVYFVDVTNLFEIRFRFSSTRWLWWFSTWWLNNSFTSTKLIWISCFWWQPWCINWIHNLKLASFIHSTFGWMVLSPFDLIIFLLYLTIFKFSLCLWLWLVLLSFLCFVLINPFHRIFIAIR